MPIKSSMISPDGKTVVAFSYSQKGSSIILYSFPKPVVFKEQSEEEMKDENLDEILEGRPWGANFGRKKFKIPEVEVVVLAPKNWPPKPVEYVVDAGLGEVFGRTQCWSPDGKHVAYFGRIDRDHALIIVDVESRDIVQVVILPLDQSFSPSYSPDGKFVYFSGAKLVRRDIYRVNLETEELVNLTDDDAFDVSPSVSPDGTRIAYASYVGDFAKLFVLDLDDMSKHQLTFGGSNDTDPSWSSNGRRLVYSSDHDSLSFGIYTYDLDTTVSKRWTDQLGGAFSPTFYPGNDNRVIYSGQVNDDQFKTHIYAPIIGILRIKVITSQSKAYTSLSPFISDFKN